jgi:hypothetical protein
MDVNVAVLVTSLVRVALMNQPTSESLLLAPKVSYYLVFFSVFISLIADSKFQALSLVGSQYHAIRRTSVARVQTTSHVSIKKVICELDINDFATSFVSTNEVIDGFIRNTPFSSGAMKYAFEVWHFYFIFRAFPIIIVSFYQFSTKSGVQYVAKRFYRLGDQEDENINFLKNSEQTVSINDQKLYMQSELSRLVIGQWFLSAFYRLAKSEGVHVHFSESSILKCCPN